MSRRRGIPYGGLSRRACGLGFQLTQRDATVSPAPLGHAPVSAGERDLELLPEFPGVVHLNQDIGAANELALHIHLRDGGPAGILLDALADLHIGEHIEGFEGNTQRVQDLHHVVGETALGHQLVALHEHKDRAAGEQLLDALLGGCVHG